MSTALKIVQNIYSGFARGDLRTVLLGLAPDVRWTEMAGFPYAGAYTGRPAVQHVLERLGADWDSFRVEVERFVDGGDAVAAVGWYSGVYRANGRRLRCRVTHVWTIRSGLVASFEQFVDTKLVADAIAGEREL